MHKYILFFLTFATLSIPIWASQMRTFTSTDGQTMRAELMDVVGDKITIKRDDGMRFTVETSLFSEKDQTYIKQWLKNKALENVNLEISCTRDKGDVKVNKHTAYTEEIFPEFYNVTFTNRGFEDLKKIRVDTIVFQTKHKPSRGTEYEEYKSSRDVIPVIEGGKEYTFQSASVKAVEFNMNKGWRWSSDEGEESTRDRLSGIWIRAYIGDKMIAEDIRPSRIEKDYKWERIFDLNPKK